MDARRQLDLPGAALQVMQATGLDQKLDMPVRLLSHGEKQALELAMVLALEPSVLLLDEPTAGLTKPERTLIGAHPRASSPARTACAFCWSSTIWTSCARSARA